METIVHNTVHVLLALALPPLLLGVIAKTKALFAGRVGPPVLQPYYDLIKLFQKGSVFSTTTTWVFRAGPVVGLVTAAIAVLLVPLANSTAPISFTGDLILLAYLLGLGRFFTASAALDTGSRVRGDGRGAGSHVRLPGGTGVLPGPARPGQAVRVAATGGHARQLAGVRTGRRPGPRSPWSCSAGSSSCWRRTRASPSTTPTPTWS